MELVFRYSRSMVEGLNHDSMYSCQIHNWVEERGE